MEQHCPPEKYYEACLTYHLIRYFREIHDRTLYPFCVSQVKEQKYGFDFGYHSGGGRLFLVQYKRPQTCAGGYAWPIRMEQLEVLAQCGLPAFYALPAFSDPLEWYEGLEKTYFISAGQVRFWLQNRSEQKSALLHEAERLFHTIPPGAFDPFRRGFESALSAERSGLEFGPAELLCRLTQEEESGLYGYWIAE